MFKKFINFINTLVFFRIKRIKIGKFPYMRGVPIVDNCGKIEIGDNFRATNKQFKIQITTDKNAEIKIGNNVFINQGANIYANKRIEIKDNVFIADLCSIYDTNFHEVEENKGVKVKEVIIHENVWLCRNVIVIAGSEIGKNSVVSAGSVVKGIFPENVLLEGNPAKIVRYLNNSENYIRKQSNIK